MLIERSDEVPNFPDAQFFIENNIEIVHDLYIVNGKKQNHALHTDDVQPVLYGDDKQYISQYGPNDKNVVLADFLKGFSHVYSIGLSRGVSIKDTDIDELHVSFKVRGVLKS